MGTTLEFSKREDNLILFVRTETDGLVPTCVLGAAISVVPAATTAFVASLRIPDQEQQVVLLERSHVNVVGSLHLSLIDLSVEVVNRSGRGSGGLSRLITRATTKQVGSIAERINAGLKIAAVTVLPAPANLGNGCQCGFPWMD